MEFLVDLELIRHVLLNLVFKHWKCFRHSREQGDLDTALFHGRIVVGLCPKGHQGFHVTLKVLGQLLFERFEQYGRIEDADEAIKHQRDTLQLLPNSDPDRSSFLNDLANTLLTRFQQHGQAPDLEEAIEHNHAALRLLPIGHLNRSRSLNDLAVSLQIRFEQNGRTIDIDGAIEYHRAALQLRPKGHSDRSASLTNLGSCLLIRFERHGQTADLDEGIKNHRAALQLYPDGHPNRSKSLTNLASSLQIRFEQLEQIADLDEAIELHRVSLQLHPDSHPNRSAPLNNLAECLRLRFLQYRQTADIDEAIKLNHTALQLCSDDHPSRSVPLTNLARSLQTRDRQQGRTADLDEAIGHIRAVLQLQPDGHPRRSGSLMCLANCLAVRFIRHRQTTDIDEAITHHRTSLQTLPNGHPDRSALLATLAASLFSRFMKFGLSDDFEECMQLLEQTTECKLTSVFKRLDAARQWAILSRSHAHHTTSRAYKAAIVLLQHALIVSPTLHAQHDFLNRKDDYRTLTLDAVAYALEENRLEEAIELLEQGRGLLWSQMRGFRTPLDRLSETNRELADGFRDVSRQLENLATSKESQLDSSATGSEALALNLHRERLLFEEKLKLKRKLSGEQEKLINEIRRIPGFEDFLTTTPFKVLQQAASEGPVIVVNLSRDRSDALIVLSGQGISVVCVPLDGEFYEDSIELGNELLETRRSSKVYSLEYDEVLRRAMKMLCDRVVSKVVERFEELGISKGARIWWCPTHGLSVLPFHAAGPFEDADGTVKYLLDDYVSSYTPTLGALINSRSRENVGKPKMLIVGDTKSLKYTRSEVLAVRNNTRSYVSCPKDQIFLDGKALRSAVIESLQDVTWIHFACHGHLGSLDASFQLSDGGLTLLDIIRADLPNAEFAFLSACHTAEQRGTWDEVLHLSAAVQFCGFRSVIGTMWEMYDPDGPLLAREVYSYMADYRLGEVIHKRSAAALRQAVLALRSQEGVQTERWVNLVHIGA